MSGMVSCKHPPLPAHIFVSKQKILLSLQIYCSFHNITKCWLLYLHISNTAGNLHSYIIFVPLMVELARP